MYRHRFHACPRCGDDLVQYGVREKWRCKACMGALLGPAELGDEIGEHRELLVVTGEEPELQCPACGGELQRMRFRGIALDRCPADSHVWFDSGELGRVRAALPSDPLVIAVTSGLVDEPER